MLEDELAQAAIDYAKEELGEEQFKNNPDAVQAISQTFVDGARWAVSKILIQSN